MSIQDLLKSPAAMERAEWRAVYAALKQAQDYLQAKGERHSWLDGARALAKERSEGKGTYAPADATELGEPK